MLFFLFQDNEYATTQNQLEVLEGDSFRSYFNGHIQVIFEEESIDGMISYVIKALKEERIDMFICHSMAHDIGHYAGYVDNFLNIELYLSKRNLDFCGSGFMHGIEGEVANHLYPENVDNLLTVCNLIKPFNPYYDGCYHGAGHAFMENTRDVLASLKQCDLLIKVEDDGSDHCYRGVFSQNASIMYKKQASLEEMLVFCNTQEVAYHSACASELHVVGQSQVLDEDAIESIFETCFDDSLSVIIQKGCLLSVTTSITDYIFAQSTDILPVTTMFAQSEEMQYIYINATYGTYAKTIQHVSDVSLVDFCNAFTQKAIIDYCLNKSRD